MKLLYRLKKKLVAIQPIQAHSYTHCSTVFNTQSVFPIFSKEHKHINQLQWHRKNPVANRFFRQTKRDFI